MQDYYTDAAVKVSWIAYHVAQAAFPRYKHPKSPHYFTFPQLAACTLLQFFFGLDSRQMERWLRENEPVLRTLELRSVPDHTTLWRTVKILRIADWEKLKKKMLEMIR